jgi:transmembrane sensor
MQENKEENNHQEERFWLLVSLQLSGEASTEELTELDGLLRENPEWGLRKELFTNIWQQKPATARTGEPAPNAEKFNRHLQLLSTHLSDPTLQYEQAENAEPAQPPRLRRGVLRKLMPIAAALTGAIIITALYTHHERSTNVSGTVSTRPGSRSRLQLPDGTQVWLNADSKLTYKIDGQSPTREVQLTGEAYFDVAKDKNRPFILHTTTIDIRVLGTSFNVQCYGNEKNTETSLFQGSVEVTLKNIPDKKIILQPSEKLIVHNNEISLTNIKTKEAEPDDEPLMTLGKVHYQQKDNSYIESLWTKNQLAFDNRSFEEVANQIERWYGVKVTITDNKLKNTRFSGVFEDESLAQVMQALQLIGDFHYTIRKKEVTITP